MNTQLFSQYAQTIKSLSDADIAAGRFENLKMDSNGKLAVYYTPFEFLNKDAKIMIVGITPGLEQFKKAVTAARDSLKKGEAPEVALEAAKKTAAFAGATRNNLIKLLDTIGLQKYLGLESCRSLFEDDFHLVQTSSLLRNAVLIDGKNYNGSSSMMRDPLVLDQVTSYFLKDAQKLEQALILPLGENANLGVNYLVEQGLIDGKRVLSGMIHPSGASGERVAYLHGEKKSQDLSPKKDAAKIDKSREMLIKKLAA